MESTESPQSSTESPQKNTETPPQTTLESNSGQNSELKKDELEALEEIEERNKALNFYATPGMVEQWKKYYIKEGHSVHSTITYYNYIRRFVGYGIKINQKAVDKFRENNRTTASAGALKKFFHFLHYKKGFPREILNFYFDKSKKTKKFPEGVNAIEVKKLIDGFPDLFHKNLTLVIYELGLRLSEALKLQWSDFNWSVWLQDTSKAGVVQIKNTKYGKFRAIPVPPYLMQKLYNEHRLRNEQGIPIGTLLFDYGVRDVLDKRELSLEEKQYYYIVLKAEDRYRKELYKVSKEVLGRRINPHKLRHAKAQDLMDKGVPIETIKEFLGHSSFLSTQIYAQASAERIRKDMEQYYKFSQEIYSNLINKDKRDIQEKTEQNQSAEPNTNEPNKPHETQEPIKEKTENAITTTV